MKFKNSIILFGGTFDPIHFGHLILAEYAKEFIDAEKVIFIPCYRPPHKINYKLSSWRHRLNMVRLAIQNNKDFELSTFEIERKGISYTYITINYFSEIYKDKNKKLYFLIGYDSLLELHTWQNYKDILKKIDFLVGDRLIEKKKKKLPSFLKGKVTFFDSPIIEISSTEIRERIKNSLSIKYLVPKEVESYIIKNKIYK